MNRARTELLDVQLSKKRRRKSDKAPRARVRKTKNSNGIPPLKGLLPLGLLLLLWQLFGNDDSPFFPRPSAWVDGLTRIFEAGQLLPALGSTTWNLALALFVATLVGTIVGIVVGASRFIDRALSPTLEFLRASPSSALVPIAVLLLGYTTSMRVTVTVIAALWPILLNVRTAMRELNPTYMDVAAMLHMTTARKIRKIILPALAPAVLLGVRVSAPIALIVTLLIEILTGVPGLGALLSAAQQRYESELLFGLLALIGILALLLNFVVVAFESWLLRYRKPNSA